MLKTQAKDTHKPRMQKREKPSQREVYRCDDCYTLDGVKTVELAKAKVGSSEHRR